MSKSHFPTRAPEEVPFPSDQPTLHTEHGSGTPVPGVPEMGVVKSSETRAVPAGFVGGYEILEELGRGGMGVVYKARQKGLGRIVALKMILHGDHAGVENRLRFQREAEALAQLRHENIVQVHEVGEHEGKPFISLEYVEGGSLDKRLREGLLPAGEAARLVEQLAKAMQAAHDVGIIHRDLKPANVLLQREVSRKDAKTQREDAETDLGGLAPLREILPKITDFGLAKRQDVGGLSASGAVLGTPSYMAPEQAAGKGREVDERADVYALGAILYECLTGRPPFRAASSMDTILQVINDEPVSVRSLQPMAPDDLETICLKCLQKEPGRRYGSARELGDDLRRFQAGEPVLARPVGRVERGWRWCKRNPAVAALTTAVALTLLVGATAATLFAVKANREAATARKAQSRAEEEKETADRQRELAETSAYVNLITLAQVELEHGSAALAWKHLLACQGKLRGWEHDYLATRFNKNTFRGHTEGVFGVALSADGKRIVSGSEDMTVKVWDADRGVEILSLKGHTDPVRCVAASANGKRIVSGDSGGAVKVWDADKGVETFSLMGDGITSGVAISADGKRIVSGGNLTVKVWDADKGTETHSLQGHEASVLCVAMSSDGKRIASGSQDATVRIWDADKGMGIHTLMGHRFPVLGVAFSADGKRIVSGAGNFGDPGEVKVWDAAKGVELLSFAVDKAQVTSVAFSADGKRLVTGSWDHTVKVWDADKGTALLEFKGHTDIVWSVIFSADGQRIVSGSHDHTVKVWDAKKGVAPPTLFGHEGPVYNVAFSPDGQRMVSASHDNTVKVWDAGKETVALTFNGHTGPVTSAAFSPDGKSIVSAGEDGNVRVWDAQRGNEILTFKEQVAAVSCVNFTPDGKQVVTACHDQTVRVWDAASGTEVLSLKGHSEPVYCVAVSADGKHFASGGQDMTIRVWDAGNGTEVVTLKGHTAPVLGVAFSPDGTRIVSTSGFSGPAAPSRPVPGEVKVWDAATGAEIRSLVGHTNGVACVAFSPDGQRFVTGSADEMLKVWDTVKGVETLSLRGHALGVSCVAFRADGKQIISGDWQGRVRIWEADRGSEKTP